MSEYQHELLEEINTFMKYTMVFQFFFTLQSIVEPNKQLLLIYELVISWEITKMCICILPSLKYCRALSLDKFRSAAIS